MTWPLYLLIRHCRKASVRSAEVWRSFIRFRVVPAGGRANGASVIGKRWRNRPPLGRSRPDEGVPDRGSCVLFTTVAASGAGGAVRPMNRDHKLRIALRGLQGPQRERAKLRLLKDPDRLSGSLGKALMGRPERIPYGQRAPGKKGSGRIRHIQVHTYLTAEEYVQLRDTARENGQSIAKMLRDLVLNGTQPVCDCDPPGACIRNPRGHFTTKGGQGNGVLLNPGYEPKQSGGRRSVSSRRAQTSQEPSTLAEYPEIDYAFAQSGR